MPQSKHRPTQEQAEAQIRALCAAGYITEQDVDEILLKE